MDKTKLNITEYRGEQEINFFGITSFKVQNHGEAVVEINTIPIYPNQTVKIIEEDGTQCDFKMIAKFTESGKMPKFKAIYKQFGNGECEDLLNKNRPYTVTLYNYEVGDVINFSQNMSSHTTLTRSFDGGQTFLPENDIDLGFVPANQVLRYDSVGSFETNAIQFRNNDLLVNSEIFTVREANAPEEPILPVFLNHFAVEYDTGIPSRFMIDFSDEIFIQGSFFKPEGLVLDRVSIGQIQPFVWYSLRDELTPFAPQGGYILVGNTNGYQSLPLHFYNEETVTYGDYHWNVDTL